MGKQDSLQALETKLTKQRDLVQKEQEKLSKLEQDYYKAFHQEVASRASLANMSISDYLEAMS